MGDPRQQQKTEQVDRLNQVPFDFAVANLLGDPGRQSRHAGERRGRSSSAGSRPPCSRNPKPPIVAASSPSALTDRVEDGVPQKDLRDDRQEPHQRPEGKVAPVDQSFFQRRPQDRPPQRQPPAQTALVLNRRRIDRCVGSHGVGAGVKWSLIDIGRLQTSRPRQGDLAQGGLRMENAAGPFLVDVVIGP